MGRVRRLVVASGVAALTAALAGCSSASTSTPRVAQLAAARWGTCTEQVSLTAGQSQMEACVDYRFSGNRLEVLASAASYTSTSGYDLPYFTFTFRDPVSAVIAYKFSSPVVEAENVFSHNTGLINLPGTAASRAIRAGDVLQVSLWAAGAASGEREQMASLTLTLYPRGLLCPALGAGASYDEATGQC